MGSTLREFCLEEYFVDDEEDDEADGYNFSIVVDRKTCRDCLENCKALMVFMPLL